MLSSTTQHALRALVQLARVPAGDSLLGHELAERASIPANFLAKIMLVLRNAGFIEATRGQGGGYCLRKDPAQIRLVDIVRLFDPAALEPGCVLGERHDCTDRQACAAHEAWKRIRQQYLDFLHTQTVGQLAQQHASRAARSVVVKKPRAAAGRVTPRASATRA